MTPEAPRHSSRLYILVAITILTIVGLIAALYLLNNPNGLGTYALKPDGKISLKEGQKAVIANADMAIQATHIKTNNECSTTSCVGGPVYSVDINIATAKGTKAQSFNLTSSPATNPSHTNSSIWGDYLITLEHAEQAPATAQLIIQKR